MKRNRKIFAILTLVAFMMTLLPLAAFADDAQVADRFASILRVDKTSIEADGNKSAEFTIYVRDKDNNPVDVPVYVASERSSDTILSDDEAKYPMVSIDYEDTTIYKFEPDANGKVVFDVKSTVPGDAEIAVGLKCEISGAAVPANPYTYLTESDITSAKADIIGSKTITFQATDTDLIALTGIETRSETVDFKFYPYRYKEDGKSYFVDFDKKTVYNEDGTLEEVKSTPIADKELSKVTEFNLADAVAKANNSDYYELTFQVRNKSNAPVEGEEVEFSINKSNARVNKENAETNEVGEVKVRVYADKHGEYVLEAREGSKYLKVELSFLPTTIDDFEVTKDVDAKIAYDEDEASNFKLQLKDSNDNDYDLNSRLDALKLVAMESIIFEWEVLPSDSDLDDDVFVDEAQKVYDEDGSLVDGFDPDEDLDDIKYIYSDNGLLQVKLPELDAEGMYELKVSLDTGKSHVFEFEAKEQGDIVELTLAYDEPTLALGATSKKPTVKRIDAEGVKLDATDSLEWSVSDYKLLDKDHDINDNNGVIKATDDDDYLGDLVVTVVDTKEDLTASAVVTIADAAVGFNLVPQTDVININEEGKVDLVVRDRQGNQVALGNSVTNVTFDYYVTAKPEGAQVTVDEASTFSKDVKEKGKTTLDVYSTKAGEVKVTVVVGYNDGSSRKLSDSVTLNFGEKVERVTYGAKNVTMFIGSTGFVADGTAGTMDQAPFIQDNRTFVPLRAVATALGATNEDTMWDPATQTITLVRPDLTVTMTIGSNVLTLSDGSTVVADVAPFIVAETGRTVIPFRAIAEAFGADVEAVFAADGTTTAVTFSQE